MKKEKIMKTRMLSEERRLRRVLVIYIHRAESLLGLHLTKMKNIDLHQLEIRWSRLMKKMVKGFKGTKRMIETKTIKNKEILEFVPPAAIA